MKCSLNEWIFHAKDMKKIVGADVGCKVEYLRFYSSLSLVYLIFIILQASFFPTILIPFYASIQEKIYVAISKCNKKWSFQSVMNSYKKIIIFDEKITTQLKKIENQINIWVNALYE